MGCGIKWDNEHSGLQLAPIHPVQGGGTTRTWGGRGREGKGKFPKKRARDGPVLN